jgi:hypothetical protein
MKRALLLTLIASAAWAADTVFVAVGTTATAMPAAKALLRKALLVENNSAAAIWCQYPAVGTDAAPAITVGRGMLVAAGDWRSFPGDGLWCAADVAQTGAGTDVTSVTEVN